MSVCPAANPNASHPASHTPSHPASRTGTVNRIELHHQATAPSTPVTHAARSTASRTAAHSALTALSRVPSSHTCCARDCGQTATT